MSNTVLKVTKDQFHMMAISDCAARPQGFKGNVWRFFADGKWNAVYASTGGVSFAVLKVERGTRISKPSRKR